MFPQHEFVLDPDLIHLNHAGVSPWPRRCADAVQAFAEAMATQSALANFPRWLETEQRLRERLARLAGVGSADDVALLKNTSEALSQVARGLDWRPGDRVVALAEEFVSNLLAWEALAADGVELVQVRPAPGQSPDDALLAACDARTRLLSVSSVQYGTGWRSDLVRIGRHCRAHDILFCVDAVQSLGALRFDAQACGADFVVAGAHKWLMGPFGIALFHCRPGLRDRIRPLAAGWHTLRDPLRFAGTLDQTEASARRFEAGTQNWAAVLGLEATLSLFEEIGADRIERRVLANAGYLADALAARDGVTVLSPRDDAHRSGNVCVTVAGVDRQALAERLERTGVLCAARGPSLRFSPHCYHPREQLDAALQSFDDACYALTSV